MNLNKTYLRRLTQIKQNTSVVIFFEFSFIFSNSSLGGGWIESIDDIL